MANKKVTELPEFFTEYCSEPYDQNIYEVHMKDGRVMAFSEYEDMRNFWFAYCRRDVLSHIVIVDKDQKPVKKGF